jgi:ATP-binding cassette subfamily F protein 3
MIQLDDVSLFLSGDPLFEKVSFSLQKGERCGLVGRNGSGKSTLLRLIVKEIEPDRGAISIPKNYRLGYLQQHIRFTKDTLLEEAALGLPEEEKEDLYKAEKILFGLGFTEEDLEKSPSQFSCGYHLRLHLAKVLISNPDCLLLDEPTNYLDILSIRWLENFLKRWKGEFILISHDREFMDSVCTHTLGIHRKKIRKIKGSTIQFFEQILLEEEVHEKTRLNLEKKHAKAMQFVERFGAKATKAAQAQSRLKMIAREPVLEKLNAIANLSFNFHEAPFPGKKMLEVKNLEFSYTDERLIHDFSLSIEKGQRLAIIGKNGRGKSTLLRLLIGDLTPKKGTLDFSDNLRIGYFGQTHIQHLLPKHTIEEEIALSNPKLNYTEVKGIAGLMMFSGDSSLKKISVLSGGEKSRVLLGKILAKSCNLLLLDEPTHHLDIESIEALIDALEEFSGSVVIVTHSELILRRLALDQIVICEEAKQKVFFGDYDLFLEKMGWEEEKKSVPLPKPVIVSEKKKVSTSSKQFEKKIRECEEKIIVLEEEQARAQAILEKGNPSPEFLKSLSQRQKQIDLLYQELDSLIQS